MDFEKLSNASKSKIKKQLLTSIAQESNKDKASSTITTSTYSSILILNLVKSILLL
jgi:hypothetical protein